MTNLVIAYLNLNAGWNAGGPPDQLEVFIVSDYNEHSSLYENSDYPSRRQAPSHRASSGGSRQAPDAPKKRRKKKNKRGITVGRVIGWIFKTIGTLILIGLCTGALVCCFAAVYINDVIVPIADLSPDDFIFNEDSIMYYQDKTTGQYVEMTELHNLTSSVWVDFEEIPKDLINATVAIEDRRFWTHPGVDWRRTGRAVLSMFTGQEISGGSTITQQLIKNQTNYNETTVKRKITEIVRAFRFTQNNSKEDTITYYLNTIPLGGDLQGRQYKGVGAAAQGYFGKSVSELTLAECASLIGITNNPSRYGPYSFARSKGFNTEEIWSGREWNKYRQEVILNQMLEQEYITREQYNEAVAQELVFIQDQGKNTGRTYSWYEETVISDVKEIMAEQYQWSNERTELALQRGGLRIYTCYDPDVQAIVDEIYTNRENLDYTAKDGSQMQSAIAVIENETGNLLAIAGQFGEKTVNLGSNYANNGHRQPGSAFKPLAVYSPALEFNKVSPYTVLDDYPYQVLGGKAWPLNSGSANYRGHLTVREALMRSLNTVAVRLMNDYVTPEESFKFVQDRYHIELEPGRMIKGEWKTDITTSLAMGGLTYGTNVRDMAEAYSVFPNNGIYQGSRTVVKITQLVDGQEVTLVDNTLERKEVIKPTTAWYMNDMMQHVFDGAGTAYGLGIKGQHAAGKTGTTSDNKDRWFVGYTPYYTAAVWTGYERGTTITGAPFNVSLDLWEKVMVPLHENLPDKDYADPGGRRAITYCMDSGMLATPYCAMDPRGSRAASGSIFPEDFPTDMNCTFHTAESVVKVCTDSPVLKDDGTPTSYYHLAGEFCPEESVKEVCYPDYEREKLGGAVAKDEAWRYERASAVEVCDVHTEEPVTEPDPEDPNNPGVTDPNNPGTVVDPQDPNAPYLPFDPNKPLKPIDPVEPLDPIKPADPGNSSSGSQNQPDNPDALPPSQDLAG